MKKIKKLQHVPFSESYENEMRQSKIQFQRTKLEPSETYYHKMENSHKNEIHKTTSHSECI